jgi:hypothetical protein
MAIHNIAPYRAGTPCHPHGSSFGALQRKFNPRRTLMHNTLRQAMLPILATIAIGAATPVLAADVVVNPPYMTQAPVGPVTLQEALVVATGIGVVTVSNTNYTGDEWEIEGRDINGKWIEVDVDSRTGEVQNVDRSIL